MAYAAVFTLKQAMADLLSISESKKLISNSDTILINDQFENLDSFLSTIKSLPSNKIVDAAATSEERRVKDAAEQLHDLIDSHLSDRLSLLSDDNHSETRFMEDEISRFSLLLSQQLLILREKICSFLTTLKIAQEQQQQQQQRYSSGFSSSDYTSVEKQQNLVGRDEQINILKGMIFDSDPSEVKTIFIRGMTGIGKTSLVKQVYNDPRVIENFETRLFVHIGPRYSRYEEIVLVILNQLGVVVPTDELSKKDEDYSGQHLCEALHEALSTTRYLIVLEDVWIHYEVLSQIRYLGFPHNDNGSCIIFISQIRITHTLSQENIIQLPLLKEDDSWKLLRQTAFTREDKCNSTLEKIGRKIARNCEGLPAAIIQVGENLCGKSFQEWKTLSENEDPLVITRDDDTPLSKALYFSYMRLPQKLKVVFMYMGVFPKEYVISRSMLIKYWISEGFIDRNLEESKAQITAGRYLDKLVFASVVLKEKMASGMFRFTLTKNCRLHFTFRSLCVNEAKSEKFFHIVKKYTNCTPENMRSQQRLCIHNNVVLAFKEVHEWMESVPNARSFLCFGPKHYPIVLPLYFRLLKILDTLAIRLYEFPQQILSLVLLRYLAIMCDRELPNSISRLENLEVLIFSRHHNIKLSNGPNYLPVDIWNMHKLKQLYCMGVDLPTPPTYDSHIVLEKLLTLSGVSAHSCTMEVLSRIPNLTKVAIYIESAHDSIETFSFFGHFASLYQEFKSFKCVVVNPNLRSQIVSCVPSFPMNVEKICLSGCGFHWKNMEVLEALPKLRVLKLRWYACSGPEWTMGDDLGKGQFCRLEFLLLEDLDIEHWKTYPYKKTVGGLHHVVIRHCYKLENIPNRLKLVDVLELDDCRPSIVKKILNWPSRLNIQVKIHNSIMDL